MISKKMKGVLLTGAVCATAITKIMKCVTERSVTHLSFFSNIGNFSKKII